MISGPILRPALIVSEDIGETMINIADNDLLMRANLLIDMLTALGIVFLGAMLFAAVRKHNEKMALVALGFYILEAGLLATSKLATFSLLRASQEYVAAGYPEYLETLGSLALESMDFVGSTLHMLAFCIGGMLFYYLLYRSRVVPRGLSLWGLVSAIPLLVGTLAATFGYELPFIIYVPYVPFELVAGIWVLVKGIRENGAVQ
jgi:hypothetical protein